MIALDDMVLFAAIVKAKGFSRAAEATGIPVATLSRRLAALEARLGEQLLRRTTRNMHLTEAGKIYHGYCETIIAQAEQASQALVDLREEPIGQLSLAGTFGSDISWGGQLISDFLQRYPRISIDATMLPEVFDIDALEFDIMFIHGRKPATRHEVHSIGEVPMMLCASPAYLARKGVPADEDALATHDIILCRAFTDPLFLPGVLHSALENCRLKCNEVIIARQSALDGCGIAWLPEVVVNSYLASGALQTLLPTLTYSLPLWLVIPANRLGMRKVAVLLQHFMSWAKVSAPWRFST